MIEKLGSVGKKNGENKAVVCEPPSVDDSLSEASNSCPEDVVIVEDDEGCQLPA